MSKRLLLILMMILMLTACGTKPSWENEKVTGVSTRILSDDVNAVWTLENDQASFGAPRKLIRLQIRKKDGRPVSGFEITHEKMLHLLVISKDLSYFNHIHPEYKGGGVFEIANDFPAGGDYRLIADFQPSGGDDMSKMTWVHIDGDPLQPSAVIPDTTLDKSFQGSRVKLTTGKLAANQDLTLTFTISDEKSGQPVTNLQPYLGAIGHVVILSQNGEQYLHVHAEGDQGTGPNAVFETSFPKSGVYKIWGQFQRNNQVFTASFAVNVPQ